jgi:putative hydrolase of HD superfamily
MSRPYPLLFDLQQLTVDLSLINRRHYLPGTKRNENDLEHSLTVALLCWYLYEKLQPSLDISLVLKYALAHDFVERYAGDISSFADPKAREEKVSKEQEALARLSGEFSEFPDLVKTMKRYELKDDEESLFVWTVDKIQQLIMGDLDNWICYVEDGISYERFIKNYTDIAQRGSKDCREIFNTVIEYCKTTYPAKP